MAARPVEHRQALASQGDLRPMAGNREAIDDLKGIRAGRAAFYSRAEFRLDTSTAPLAPSFEALRKIVRKALKLPG